MATLKDKLLSIQSELKAPKSQTNNFGHYKYRNCSDILEAVKPLLKKNKATLLISDDIVAVANRIYVKATVTLSDAEKEDSITTTAFAREEDSKKGMDASQVTGASSSYARKYALNGLFCIDDTKDADALNTSKEYTQRQQADSEALLMAIGDVKIATSFPAIQEIWNKHPEFQQNVKFKSACNNRSKELKVV